MIAQVLLIIPILAILLSVCGPPTRWERTHASLGERLLFRAALGMGILSYLILGLGLLGFLNRTALGILTAVLFFAAMPGSRALGLELRRKRDGHEDRPPADRRSDALSRERGEADLPEPSPDSWIQAALAVGIGILALLMLFGAASPPTGADWDGLSYHLADPKLFLQAGRIVPLPWEHHSNFPFLVQMLFTYGLAFDSVALAKGFHLAMGFLTAGALTTAYLRLSRSDPKDVEAPASRARHGLLTLLPAALFLGAPHVFWEATVAYVDLGATLYAFLAVYAFTLAMEERNPPEVRGDCEEHEDAETFSRRPIWLLIAGVMTGFALGSKTTNGIFLILLSLWWLWRRWDRSFRWRGAGTFALWYLLPAILIAAPWFLKTYLWTDNPVYPFLYGIFGGRNWNAELARLYEIEQAGFGMGRSPAALLLLPWNLTFHPTAFSKGIGFFASMGPYALALLPLLVIARPLPRWAKAYLGLALGFLVIWVALTQQIRYLLPLYPALCLLCAVAADRASIRPWGRSAVGLFTGGSLLLTVFMGFNYVQPMIPVALGMASPEQYLSSRSELYPAYRYVNENLPEDAKILLIEETRGFYLDREYLWGNPGHHTLIPWESFRTPEEMAAWLRRNGFTHLLLNRRWIRPEWGESPFGALILKGAETGALGHVFGERGVEVYEIRP
ncbi:MAG: phospholipid carrier-dependent glycosyltransferase [Armatimonadetes bacterium]|nr:phospholipid carrier-dependent glycosyltransferase [Armatimonadota bacterium]